MTSSSFPINLGPASAPPSRFRIYLKLGRVSNLPTVWTNVMAGVALGRGGFEPVPMLLCLGATSSLYVGGMFLNDAFDRHIDAAERAERPIPRGWIGAGHVFAIGFALLGAGIALAVGAAAVLGAGSSLTTFIAASLLAAAVVLYDVWHKRNPIAPWIMGACRSLVYLTAAFALGGRLTTSLMGGATTLLLYVVGLTWVARGERPGAVPKKWPRTLLLAPALWVMTLMRTQSLTLSTCLVGLTLLLLWIVWSLAPLEASTPRVPSAVIRMIAGISIVDALFTSTVLGPGALVLGPLAVVATLGLQRVARGT